MVNAKVLEFLNFTAWFNSNYASFDKQITINAKKQVTKETNEDAVHGSTRILRVAAMRLTENVQAWPIRWHVTCH